MLNYKKKPRNRKTLNFFNELKVHDFMKYHEEIEKINFLYKKKNIELRAERQLGHY
jgi:hypothetical protein